MSFDPLLLAGESQTVEFKTSFDKTTVESLVAFANAQSGTVLVGVSNAGLIHGASLGKETLNEWLGQIKSAASSGIRKALRDYPEIEFEIKEFAGGVMVTFAQKQPEAPYGGVSGSVTLPESAYLLQLIQTQPGLKTVELVAQTGKPLRTIERWLKQLKENGLIEFRGAPKTGGYYRT